VTARRYGRRWAHHQFHGQRAARFLVHASFDPIE